METFRTLIGHRFDAEIRKALSPHEDAGRIVRLTVPQAELGRKRFKAVDQDGIEYGIALPRNVTLRDGSVLDLTADRAVVIEARETEQLHLRARDAEGGIQLGWHAGHLHWKVRMAGEYVTVLMDGPREDYLVRIEQFLDSGLIEVVDSGARTDGAAVAVHEPHTHGDGEHSHTHGEEIGGGGAPGAGAHSHGAATAAAGAGR
ncbi:urease accessory protein UreE [Dietzia cercidiphylli]|uniref:urease accessory protein UreE n=1 Tax=Dietzia TaxID=37914 RepID=UPI0015F996E9|nr:hypothetical protein [Dietzia sp. B19]MBB1058533.1 hypothetical protein [Dietzia sp. B19]